MRGGRCQEHRLQRWGERSGGRAGGNARVPAGARPGEGAGGTHSETCTKMSSDPFSGVMKPWPCERENCLQTPLNTGPAEARAVLKIREGAWSRGLGTPLPPPPGPCLRSLPPGYGKCSLGQRPPIVRLVQSSHHPFGQ